MAINVGDLIKHGTAAIQEATGLQVANVTGLEPSEIGWNLWVELLERKSIPNTMDLLALYRIQLDNAGKILGFSRSSIRHRGDTEDADPR